MCLCLSEIIYITPSTANNCVCFSILGWNIFSQYADCYMQRIWEFCCRVHTYTLTDTHARTHSLTVDILAALTSSNSLVQWQEHPFLRQKNHKKWKEKFILQLSHWNGTQESDALKVKWSDYIFQKFRKCHSRNTSKISAMKRSYSLSYRFTCFEKFGHSVSSVQHWYFDAAMIKKM